MLWYTFNFFGVSAFEAMKKEDNTIKENLTKNFYEQVPFDVSLYMKINLGNLSYFESFSKNCVRDFGEILI